MAYRFAQVHENEVYDVPKWAFSPGVTFSVGEAAEVLGLSRPTLIRYLDSYGLSVIREQNLRKRRRFLVSEVNALKRRMAEVTVEDLAAKPPKKRRKWNAEEGWGNGLLGTRKGKR